MSIVPSFGLQVLYVEGSRGLFLFGLDSNIPNDISQVIIRVGSYPNVEWNGEVIMQVCEVACILGVFQKCVPGWLLLPMFHTSYHILSSG